MKKEDLFYLAGLFDGEGSIYITQTHKRKKIYHNLTVRLTSTNKEILDWCKEIIDLGTIQIRKKIDNRKQAYDWSLKGRQAEKLLKILHPYLRIKKKQAEIGILFFLDRRERFKGRANPLTKEDIERREDLRLSIRKLNQK